MKRMTSRAGLGRAIFCGLMALAPGAALAQQYPIRPIKLVVPFSPGGSVDALARLEAESISKRLGQPILIENQAGAGGLVGAQAVVRAAPDGYTLLAGAAGPIVLQPLSSPVPAYNPARDLVPVGHLHNLDLLLVAPASLPVNTIQEFIALARSKPGALKYASSGIGGNAHLSIALLTQMTSIDLLHVPYKSDIDSIGALGRGEVDISQTGVTTALPLIRAGRLKALAAAGKNRSALLPAVPTVAESGVPGYVVVSFMGWHAPRGTPTEIIRHLNAAMVKTMNEPAIRERLLQLGATPVGGTPEEYAEFLRIEIEKWGAAIQKAGLSK